MSATTGIETATAPILLRQETDEGVVFLTLNRPQQYNALSEAMLAALSAAFEQLAARKDLRAVVLRGEGRAFCAGHDLKEMRAHPEEGYYRRLFETCGRMMVSIVQLPVPVIAQVQGIATAAGCQLVATCDLAVAAEEARFATSGINVGLFCSTPAVAVTRNVPMKPAFEMLMTGDFIDAEEARRLGLVNRVVPAAELAGAVEELLASILSKSPLAVRTGKRLFYRQLGLNLKEAYDYAADVMACNMMAEDAGEGIDAFIGKRKPHWRGH